jgi:hypothetical protein
VEEEKDGKEAGKPPNGGRRSWKGKGASPKLCNLVGRFYTGIFSAFKDSVTLPCHHRPGNCGLKSKVQVCAFLSVP